MIQGHIQVVQACMNIMASRDEKPIQWLLTLFYDMLREDSSSYAIFEEASKQKIEVYKPLMALLLRPGDNYTADKEMHVIKKLRETLTYSRVEKVIRLCLTVLKNFLGNKSLCEDIVEEGILEAVQQLEFEKWRDAELYDDIKDMAIQIGSEVSEMSNFERYERELQTGKLQWGFIHSSKFWAENVLKFESNDFRALKVLASLLQSPATDDTTLAVACHDIGEFVTLHPLGKKKVAQLQVKEKVMELMAAPEQKSREVRREALLCCRELSESWSNHNVALTNQTY
ncbi:Probable V-type proton ATPase subunit H (V-ATPase subunit H) (Vacuolar proton pump subunit H) [Durusdinium trenchii]|uniref:Probable V-type proton ATPase subunit H (V-ATPase subunit H) (Vacuolar proton pump subunit H) n=1 Tax=Durusdinium trenchii TaxID=1381693 RepID=A0ABP0NML5_9DINO